MTTTTLTPDDLDQFTGTVQWHRHGLARDLLYTDGAKYLADKAGAYWLLDEIVLAQRFERRVAREGFQVWRLTVNADRAAMLACEDGDGREVASKRIAYTDFPLAEIRLYFTGGVILLPSEY